MKYPRFALVSILFALFSLTAIGQKAEVAISLNESFFDAALEAVFQAGAPLEFSIAQASGNKTIESLLSNSFTVKNACSETIKIQREIGGVRTAVRFREGKILAPLAFSGNYNPPFIGCVAFSGWAESVIDLEVDQNAQRLVARARVLNVNLSGTGGMGSSVVAKLVQGSIDKKINPIELFQFSKLSFALPVKGAGDIQMRATGVRHELQNGVINVVVSYEFGK